MIKILSVAALGITLSGCSVSYAHYKTPEVPTQTDLATMSRKSNFIELMNVISENWHVAPTQDLKIKVERLIYLSLIHI